MIRLLREAAGYGVVSVFALIVDITILWALVDLCSMHYLTAATISFLTGAVIAYLLSTRLVFKQRRLKDRQIELAAFVGIGAVGLAINSAAIFLAVNYFGLHYLAAKCVSAGFTFSCNFIARRQLLFVPRRTV